MPRLLHNFLLIDRTIDGIPISECRTCGAIFIPTEEHPSMAMPCKPSYDGEFHRLTPGRSKPASPAVRAAVFRRMRLSTRTRSA